MPDQIDFENLVDEDATHNALTFDMLAYVGSENGLLKGSKPFAGFAAGEFESFFSTIKVEADDIPTYLENTQKIIAHRISGGEPGLPIDEKNHGGDAAGWITNAQAGEVTNSNGDQVPVIEFFSEWTPLGIEKISNKLQTNFSPTFHSGKKIIVGGSLTNYPASVDENMMPLFPAVTLSQKLSKAGDDLRSWLKAQIHQVKEELSNESEENNNGGNTDMPDLTLENLSDDDRATVVAEAQKMLFETLGITEEDLENKSVREKLDLVSLSGVTDVAKITEKLIDQFDNILEDEVDEMEKLMEQRVTDKLKARREQQDMVRLCANLTGGTPSVPYGLKMDRVELQEVLLDIPSDVRSKVVSMLTSIWENGRIDFADAGHNQDLKEGTIELSDELQGMLKAHLAKGGSIDGWFEAVGDTLGSQSQYNLAKFRKEDK